VYSLLLKVGPWAAVAALAFGWVQAEKSRAKEAGRIEVLQAQRDSVLEAHDALQTVMADSVEALAARKDTVRVVGEALVDTLLASVTDTVLVEQIREVVDTLRAECRLCEQQNLLLVTALDREKDQHSITRTLLVDARKQRRGKLLSVGLTLGVSGVYTDRLHVGPGVTLGVTLNLF
jgi:hypothetical protein